MTTTQQRPELDQDALGEFVGRVIGDLGATFSAALVVIGDRLGLYRAMADGAPVTPEQLAGTIGSAAKLHFKLLDGLTNRLQRSFEPFGAPDAAFGELAESLVEIGEVAGEAGNQSLAGRILCSKMLGQMLDLRANRLEPC